MNLEQVAQILRALPPDLLPAIFTALAHAFTADPSMQPDLAAAVETKDWRLFVKGHGATLLPVLAPLLENPMIAAALLKLL